MIVTVSGIAVVFVIRALTWLGFPDTRWAADDDVAFFVDEIAGGQSQQLLPVEAGVEVEVKGFHGFGGVEGGPPQP